MLLPKIMQRLWLERQLCILKLLPINISKTNGISSYYINDIVSTFLYSNKHIIYLACRNKNIPFSLCSGHFLLYLVPILPICITHFFLLLTSVHVGFFPTLICSVFPFSVSGVFHFPDDYFSIKCQVQGEDL